MVHTTKCLGLVSAALALVLIGCGDDAASCPLVEGTGTAQQLIGPTGGTLELIGGGKLEIPAGALDEDVMISITELDDPKPLPLGLDPAGKAIAFEPHGTVFNSPVTLTVPIKETETDLSQVRAMKLDDDEDDSWTTVLDGEKTPGKITLETTSFSIYMAARPRRNSGVVVLPDGAVVLPMSDAGTTLDSGSDAQLSDASQLDAATLDAATLDAATLDAATLDAATDSGCDPLTEQCPVGAMTQLVAGTAHLCALYESGVVYCWGSGSSGESGQGTQVSVARPGPVQLYTGVNLTDVIDISANARGTHTCAARGDGSVVCWGANTDGRCGSDAPSPALRAYLVPGVSNAVAVSAGTTHSCAVRNDGHVFCWGSNSSGQLVMGSTTPASSATPLEMVEDDGQGAPRPIADAIDVAAGMNHTCVVHSDRLRVSCGGNNATGGGHQGILGRGAIGGGAFPIADEATLPQGTQVLSLHMGASFYASTTCVLQAVGRPLCWGYNGGYAIGPSGALSLLVPTALDPYYSMPQQIALGNEFTCVSYVHPNFGPRVACQGYDSAGQLGDGTIDGASDAVPDDVVTNATETAYLDGSDVEFMAAGNNFLCAKLVGGGVVCWGSNVSEIRGQSGSGTAYCDLANPIPGLPSP